MVRPFSRREAIIDAGIAGATAFTARQAVAEHGYLRALGRFVRAPELHNRIALFQAARAMGNSMLVTTFCDQSADPQTSVNQMLSELKANNKKTWSRLLVALLQTRPESYGAFKELSPFRHQLFLVVEFMGDRATIRGDEVSFFQTLLATSSHTDHPGPHVVTMPYPSRRRVKVLCSTSPRKKP